MKTLYCFSIASVFALLLFQSPAAAAVISRDWKTPGDGLLTYDDANQREWLDLPVTVLADQFPFPGADRDAKYQYVVSQLAPGGLYEGFSVAMGDDVSALAQSAGINTSSQNFQVNSVPTLKLTDLLGLTVLSGSQSRITVGLLREIEFHNPPLPDLRIAAIFFTGFSNQSGLQIGAGQYQFPTAPGVMLYRSIPEPTSRLILLIGGHFAVCGRKGVRNLCS